jgi:hypothetical protein
MKSYNFDITLPDRIKVQEIRFAYRKLAAESPGPGCTPDQAAVYMQKRDDLAYQVIGMCGFTNEDPVIELAVGHDVLTYIVQGPIKSRVPSFDEIEQMIGKLMLADGQMKEKLEAINGILSEFKLIAATPQPPVAEADEKGDPTQPPT